MTVTTRRERRQQQRRQEQRRSGGSGGSRGVGQVWIVVGVVVGVIALILIGRAAGVFEPPAAQNVDVNSSQFDVSGLTIGEHRDDIGNGHVATAQRVTYPSVPPTSGEHWAQPAAPAPWGIKTSWLPWEVTTHNLEHGGVIVVYSPDLSSEQVETLRGLVRQLNAAGYPKIILEPWPDMPKESKVILTAWNWILKLPAIDQAQIIKFTKVHHAGPDAPERNVS